MRVPEKLWRCSCKGGPAKLQQSWQSILGGVTFTDLKKPFTSLIKHKSRCKVTSMVDESYTYPNY